MLRHREKQTDGAEGTLGTYRHIIAMPHIELQGKHLMKHLHQHFLDNLISSSYPRTPSLSLPFCLIQFPFWHQQSKLHCQTMMIFNVHID